MVLCRNLNFLKAIHFLNITKNQIFLKYWFYFNILVFLENFQTRNLIIASFRQWSVSWIIQISDASFSQIVSTMYYQKSYYFLVLIFYSSFLINKQSSTLPFYKSDWLRQFFMELANILWYTSWYDISKSTFKH